MKSFSEYKSRSYSDVTFCDDPLDKSYDWTFLPDPLVDNVFHLSDDLDSEGTFILGILSFLYNADLQYGFRFKKISLITVGLTSKNKQTIFSLQ